MEGAMSLGEVHGLFHPVKKEHFLERKRLRRNEEIWRKILDDGKERLYQNIFKYFPEVSTVIDSSKDPFWIKEQTKVLNNYSNIQANNILIFKKVDALFSSFHKRGLQRFLPKVYINYHRRYFSLISPDLVLNYNQLVSTDYDVTRRMQSVGIEIKIEGNQSLQINGYNFFGSDTVKNYDTIKLEPSSGKAVDNQHETKLKSLINQYSSLEKMENELFELTSDGNKRCFSEIGYSNLRIKLYMLWERIRRRVFCMKYILTSNG